MTFSISQRSSPGTVIGGSRRKSLFAKAYATNTSTETSGTWPMLRTCPLERASFGQTICRAPSIASDPKRLQQILKNLLSNAVKFTDRHGVTLNVAPVKLVTKGWSPRPPEHLSRAQARWLPSLCEDTGIGIAAREATAHHLRGLPAGRRRHLAANTAVQGWGLPSAVRSGGPARRRDQTRQRAHEPGQHVHSLSARSVILDRNRSARPASPNSRATSTSTRCRPKSAASCHTDVADKVEEHIDEDAPETPIKLSARTTTSLLIIDAMTTHYARIASRGRGTRSRASRA